MPLYEIQQVYTESYCLKKYLPTIMSPSHFIYEKDLLPIYYSLQNPSTHVFSPKSREATNTLLELRELENIMRIFAEELSNVNCPCADTILTKIAKNIEFNYYHSKLDRYRVVQMTDEIIKSDKRFLSVHKNFKKDAATFSSDAPFLRGCISIKSNLQTSI